MDKLELLQADGNAFTGTSLAEIDHLDNAIIYQDNIVSQLLVLKATTNDNAEALKNIQIDIIEDSCTNL